MLPQGRFQAFLRARSEERHALLRQVFRTGRFDRIEQWLRDRRLELRRSSATHGRAVAAPGQPGQRGRPRSRSRRAGTSRPLPARRPTAASRPGSTDHLARPWPTSGPRPSRAGRRPARRRHGGRRPRRRPRARRRGRPPTPRRVGPAGRARRDGPRRPARAAATRRARRGRWHSSRSPRRRTPTWSSDRRRRASAVVTARWLPDRRLRPARLPATTSCRRLLAAARRALDIADAAQPDAQRLHEVTRLCDEVADLLAGATARASRALRASSRPRRSGCGSRGRSRSRAGGGAAPAVAAGDPGSGS